MESWLNFSHLILSTLYFNEALLFFAWAGALISAYTVTPDLWAKVFGKDANLDETEVPVILWRIITLLLVTLAHIILISFLLTVSVSY